MNIPDNIPYGAYPNATELETAFAALSRPEINTCQTRTWSRLATVVSAAAEWIRLESDSSVEDQRDLVKAHEALSVVTAELRKYTPLH